MPLLTNRVCSAALLIALLGWLHSFEAAFRHLTFDLRALLWLCSSLSVLALYRVLLSQRAPELRWLRVAIGLTISIGLLSAATLLVAEGDQRHWPLEESSALRFGTDDLLGTPPGVTLLLCTPSVVVFGRERGSVERFVAIVSDSILVGSAQMLPPDFAAYARLVEPALGALDEGTRERTIALDFLRWQFPRHILLVSVPPAAPSVFLGEPLGVERRKVWGCDQVAIAGSVIAVEEDNRTGESGVYPVDPLFEDMLRGQLGSRLLSYSNFVRYIFAPHDRRDLVNDPYFALVRRDASALKAHIDALPKARRDFVQARIAPPSRGASN